MNKQQEPSSSEIEQMLDNLDVTKLGEWEKSFIGSIKAYFKKNRKLSPKQSKRLVELWEKTHKP